MLGLVRLRIDARRGRGAVCRFVSVVRFTRALHRLTDNRQVGLRQVARESCWRVVDGQIVRYGKFQCLALERSPEWGRLHNGLRREPSVWDCLCRLAQIVMTMRARLDLWAGECGVSPDFVQAPESLTWATQNSIGRWS